MSEVEQAPWQKGLKMEAFPREFQLDMKEFIGQRTALFAYYAAFPEDKFSTEIATGSDSPRQELIHQIEHTYARAKALGTGNLPSYKYREEYPELQSLDGLDKKTLINYFGTLTKFFLDFYQKPEAVEKRVKIPFVTYPMSTKILLRKMKEHDILHLGMLVKMADVFGTPRPQAMKDIWG